jgi:TonB family protein
MQVELSKILSGLIKLAVTISLASLISLANASSVDLESPTPDALSLRSNLTSSSTSINSAALNTAAESLSDYPRGATQSVLKSTDDNEITIKLDNPTEKTIVSQNIIIASQDTSSAQQAGLFRIYRSNLLKKTYQHVIYPGSAVDRDQQGDVILKLTISREGEIQKVDYDKRADFSSLNKAAARAVKNATPYPAAPKQLLGETFEVIMPIKFRLAR